MTTARWHSGRDVLFAGPCQYLKVTRHVLGTSLATQTYQPLSRAASRRQRLVLSCNAPARDSAKQTLKGHLFCSPLTLCSIRTKPNDRNPSYANTWDEMSDKVQVLRSSFSFFHPGKEKKKKNLLPLKELPQCR